MRQVRAKERGFTLVEMLIALVIFGMITAAGVTLLTLTVRTRDSADRQLENVGDLRQTRPAFTGGDGSVALLHAFVRRGLENDSTFRSSLQRVEYRLREGRLERWRYAAVDGEERPMTMPLLEGVRRVQLRYRDRDGTWPDRWDPTDPARLPAAVELVSDSTVTDTTSDSESQGQVRQLFLVGSGR